MRREVQVARGLYGHWATDAIIAAVKREPWESTRYIAREVGVCQLRVPIGLDDRIDRYHYSRNDRPLHLFT